MFECVAVPTIDCSFGLFVCCFRLKLRHEFCVLPVARPQNLELHSTRMNTNSSETMLASLLSHSRNANGDVAISQAHGGRVSGRRQTYIQIRVKGQSSNKVLTSLLRMNGLLLLLSTSDSHHRVIRQEVEGEFQFQVRSTPYTLFACSYQLCILFLYWTICKSSSCFLQVSGQVPRRITFQDSKLSLSLSMKEYSCCRISKYRM